VLDLDVDKYAVEILDKRLGSPALVLYRREPTSRERFLYQTRKVVRNGKRIELRTHEVRQEFGLAVLTGFDEHPGLTASGQQLSCDPAAKGYRADWRELLATRQDWIDIVAQDAFESAQAKPEIDTGLEFVVAGADEESGDRCQEPEEGPPHDPGLVEELDDPLAP